MGSTESFCEHYQRKCLLLSPCCNKEYRCRFCHDENENHNLDRITVQNIVCVQCQTKQKVGRNCESCGILFGNYSCIQCRLFDDVDKGQFHCDGCGVCRVGGRDNFFHCSVCNMCISVNIRDTHKCLNDVSKANCPVCLEFIHTSRKSIHVPNCSHMMHWDCYRGMLQHGNYACPVCNRSLEDMTQYWKSLDTAIDETPMPELYRNYKVNILCRDCQKESQVNFHVVGLKCQHCGGYNTTRIGGDDPVPTDPLNTLQDLVQELENREAEEAEENESNGEESWETVSEGEHENEATGVENETVEQKDEDRDEERERNTEETRNANYSLD